WAAGRGARIINMSFAGPNDTRLNDALLKASRKGIVLIAAAGNAGPNSPPLYPAADPNVMAVTATDSEDALFSGANRGSHIAVPAKAGTQESRNVACAWGSWIPRLRGNERMRIAASYREPTVRSVISLRMIFPPFITNLTRCNSVMSASGSPDTAIRSANLPFSIDPTRSSSP